MNNSQLINQDSKNFEYYTPNFIIEAARKTMGSIDLDPCSSILANNTVKAGVFYSIEHNGLEQSFFGNVWMNHPFSKQNNKNWINKVITEYKKKSFNQLIMITFASTSEKWFQPLLQFPQVFLSPRTNYFDPQGNVVKGVTKGSVVTGINVDIQKFSDSFKGLGTLKIAY